MADDKKVPEGDERDLEGEGSYRASRKYDDDVREFIEKDDPEARARKAIEEVERDAPAYRKAEEEGKRHAAEEDPELYRKGEREED